MSDAVISESGDSVARLMRENAWFRVAQRLARVGHFIFDPRTQGSEWSDALYDILGVARARPASFETFLSLLDPVEAARVRDNVARPVLDTFGADFRFNRADDGRLRHGRITGIIERDAARRPITIMGALQDITDSKAAEQAARAAERRLEASARFEALNALAHRLSHDLNNVLTVMVGSAELIADAGAADETLRDDVATLADAADRVRRLTGRLTGFARPAVPAGLPMPLDGMMRAITPTIEEVLGARIALHLDVDTPEIATTLSADQLEQILTELARNAVDVMPDGGELSVRARIDPSAADPCVRIDVTDTGPGMSPTVRLHAFDPFFTTRDTPGARGIGLSSCHALVSGAGGRIEISDTSPAGTTVSIALPAHPVTATTRPDGAGDETVLLVDDDPALRRIVARALRHCGYRVIGGTDPHAVLEMARSGGLPPVDIVLSDVAMPGITGPSLVAQLRRLHPGLPAVLMTGGPTPNLAERGDLPVLHKPFTLAHLCVTLRAAMDRARVSALAEHAPRLPTDGASAAGGR